MLQTLIGIGVFALGFFIYVTAVSLWSCWDKIRQDEYRKETAKYRAQWARQMRNRGGFYGYTGGEFEEPQEKKSWLWW